MGHWKKYLLFGWATWKYTHINAGPSRKKQGFLTFPPAPPPDKKWTVPYTCFIFKHNLNFLWNKQSLLSVAAQTKKCWIFVYRSQQFGINRNETFFNFYEILFYSVQFKSYVNSITTEDDSKSWWDMLCLRKIVFSLKYSSC